MGYKANPDSAMWKYDQSWLVAKTQKERAGLYSSEVTLMFNYKTSDGTYPVVGLDWWEYMDKWGERADWGLVSPRDNAYDGKEAVVARAKDPWGYSTGGEESDYGDFISTVRDTNMAVDQQLRGECERNRDLQGTRISTTSPDR
jgi:hypothetical protein